MADRISNLTDRPALARNRHRVRHEAMFLHALAADELKDRLEVVNRAFTKPAVVTGFPEFWAGVFPGARIVSDDDTLNLAQGAHDLVIHALSLHWANDPVGQLVQSRLALRPDGLFLAVLFGGRTLSELRAALGEAEVRATGGLSPRVAPMGDVRDYGALLQRAGFALPVADALAQTVSYADMGALLNDLRAMGEGNALSQRLKRPSRREVFEEAARVYTRSFATREGRIPATFEMVFLSGWAPDASQQKPLRPGSAQMRLADALGVTETKLTD
jgi:SAM-dependent methyltransferase